MIIHRHPFTIHHFALLGSTNDFLKSLAAGEPEFTCAVADEQTAGRGRRDRQWHSSPGEGLYLSVLLLPSSTRKISLLSLMSSIAVAETLIERNVIGVDIKWPNDVLLNDRKLCGILVEGIGTAATSTESGKPRVIVGIGVNLNHLSFPDEISSAATSLKIETGQATVVDEFRDQLLGKLADWYARWQSGEWQLILDRWQQLSSYARGLQVTIALDGETLVGETSGLTDDGALIVRLPDGSLRTILSGDVTRLRKSLNA